MAIEKRRKTAETDIYVGIGNSETSIATGNGFFDHMLNLFAFHWGITLQIKACGDYQTGLHHTVEDIGIVLGRALNELWQNKQGLHRYGHIILPMDEALVLVACDLSARPYLGFEMSCQSQTVAGFSVELVEEFLRSLVNNAQITLHIKQLAGRNTHHIIEAVFKGLGRVMKQCSQKTGAAIPSSKGVLQ